MGCRGHSLIKMFNVIVMRIQREVVVLQRCSPDSGSTDFSFNHLETGGNGQQLVQYVIESREPDDKQGVQGKNLVQQGRDVVQRCAESGTLQVRADISNKASVEQGYIQWSENGSVCIPDRPDVAGVRVQQLPRFPHCPGQSVDRVVLSRPRAKSVVSSSYPGLADIYDRVSTSARPNYRGCKIPVPSGLNIQAWRRKASLISDNSLIDMLECGFPAGFTGGMVPRENLVNHGSAVRYPTDVKKFLEKECRLGAMMGPFVEPPFRGWNRVNPLMTRPNRGVTERRVILDLSYPLGDSVNAAVPANELDGCDFKMRLPNPWSLAWGILECGRGAQLNKVDLSRAYRQLRTCPLDWPLLTVGWDDKVFVDIAVPFGLRHGTSACQRTTEAVSEIVASEVGASTRPYIDDTAGVAVPLVAMSHYEHLINCMSQLGLDAAPDKCAPPSTRMCWIGVIFDSVQMTMEIEEGRVQEALEWCDKMLYGGEITKHEFQRFIGKLAYASRCTYSARTFTSRSAEWSGKTVLLFTDNWATACAVESGRAEDPLIRGALRELWYWAATRDVDIVVRHIPGQSMGVVDALSRRAFDVGAANRVHEFMQGAVESECKLCDVLLRPPLAL